MTSNFISIQDLRNEEDRKKTNNQSIYKYLKQFSCLLKLFDLPTDANILVFIDDVYFNTQYEIDDICVKVCKEGKISFSTFQQYLQSVYKCLKHFDYFPKILGSEFENIVAFFELKSYELAQKEKDGELNFASKNKENKENEKNENNENNEEKKENGKMSDDSISEEENENNEEIKNIDNNENNGKGGNTKTIEVQNHHIKDNNANKQTINKSDKPDKPDKLDQIDKNDKNKKDDKDDTKNNTKDDKDINKNNSLNKEDSQQCIVNENKNNEIKYITLREDEFHQQKVDFANKICEEKINFANKICEEKLSSVKHDFKIMYDELLSLVNDTLEEIQKSENMESVKTIGRIVTNINDKTKKYNNILFKM